MNIALWSAQGLLAVAFLMAGVMKITQPKEKLKANMSWVEDFAPTTIRLIGILEFLAAIGLVLPWLTGIMTGLTPLAAGGLVLTMIGGALTHVRRGEYSVIWVNVVLLLLAAFVTYGRFIVNYVN